MFYDSIFNVSEVCKKMTRICFIECNSAENSLFLMDGELTEELKLLKRHYCFQN